MKKSLLLGLSAIIALGFASCNKNDDYSQTTSIAIPAFNLFTSVSGNEAPFVGTSTYSFSVKYPDETITVSTSNMTTPSGSAATFTTIPMSLKSKVITVDETAREVLNFSAQEATESGSKIYSLNGELTQAVNFPKNYQNVDALPGYKWLIPTSSFHHIFMQYRYGENWEVRTFWPDVTYRGTTVTAFPQDPAGYTTDGIQYRIVMQFNEDDLSLNKKADLIIYDAKFAPQSPDIQYIVLKDLNIEFNENGYTVSGTEALPFMVEGGEYIPLSKFMFNNIKAVVSGDLTGISISYTVAGIYTGTFNGSCIAK